MTLPNETLLYIASEIQSNIRELEGALIRVIAYASLQNMPITPQVAEEALRDIIAANKTRVVTVEMIQSFVSAHFGVQVGELKGQKRTRSVTFPRQVAMYLARELTDASLPRIGEEFGGRDHSTVIHAYEKIRARLEQEPELMETVRQLRQRLENPGR